MVQWPNHFGTESMMRSLRMARLRQIAQDAIAYCKAVSDRWTEASASMNRTALLMVVAAAVFQALTMRIAEKVEIAGFEFKNVDTIRAFLPAFVAYLYFEFIILGISAQT